MQNIVVNLPNLISDGLTGRFIERTIDALDGELFHTMDNTVKILQNRIGGLQPRDSMIRVPKILLGFLTADQAQDCTCLDEVV